MFVKLLFVPNRGFVMLTFDKNKCAQTFLVYTNLLHIVTKYKIQLNYAVYYRQSSVLRLVKV